MSFNDNSSLDSSRVSDRRGAGRTAGIALGGGGGILALVLALLFGGDQFSNLINGAPDTQQTQMQGGAATEECKTGADANNREDCRVVGTLQSLDSFWRADGAERLRVNWERPDAVLFSQGVNTACGSASSAVGPFYCPGDSTIYLDPTFFAELTRNYGADDGALAQEYVVAHEYGHHMQNLTGSIQNSSRGSGATGGSVRVELQADCYAGAWAKHAATTTDSSGQPLLKPLTDTDIRSALSAASAVGDDHIQKKSTGHVDPDSWSHGSSAQREAWFTQGYSTGDPAQCNTFNAQDLNHP